MKALEDVRVRARALQLSLPTDRLQQVWSELRVGGEAAPAAATGDDAPHDVAGEGKDSAGAVGGSNVVSLAAIAHRLFAADAGGGGDGPGSEGSRAQDDAREAGNEPPTQHVAAMKGDGVSDVGAAELYAAYCAIAGQAGLFRALNGGEVVLLPANAKGPSRHDDGRSSVAASAGRGEAGIEGFVRMLRSRLPLQESDAQGGDAANRGRVSHGLDQGAAARRGLPTSPDIPDSRDSSDSRDIASIGGGAGTGAAKSLESEDDAFAEYWAVLERVAVGSASPSVLPPALQRVVGEFARAQDEGAGDRTGDAGGSRGAGHTMSQTLAAMLVELGWWRTGDNIHLRRTRQALGMPAAAEEAARAVLEEPPADVVAALRSRVEAEAFAIDDSIETADVDDAIALVSDANGAEWIHVHVADPSRLVPPGSGLDEVATGHDENA